MDSIEITLNNYGIFTFQKRWLDRFLLFSHSIMNYINSPTELQESFVSDKNLQIGCLFSKVVKIAKMQYLDLLPSFKHLAMHYGSSRRVSSGATKPLKT